jgi:chitinase
MYGRKLNAFSLTVQQNKECRKKTRCRVGRSLALKVVYPDLKIVIAIGGWTGSVWFSDAAADANSRQAFVASCIDLLLDGNLPLVNGAGGPGSAAGIFDGFDIDWEYPITGGDSGTHHSSNDDVNLTELLAELRRQLTAWQLVTCEDCGDGIHARRLQAGRVAGSYGLP